MLQSTPAPEIHQDSGGRYIKLYVDPFRALVSNCHLTRAEIGELIILACFIGPDNTCWPGKTASAASVGMKSGQAARRIQHDLKAKGALDWDFDHDRRSPRFHLPGCFLFGTGSYQNTNRTPTGVHNNTSREGCNSTSRGVYNCIPELEINQNQSQLEKEISESASALTPDSFNEGNKASGSATSPANPSASDLATPQPAVEQPAAADKQSAHQQATQQPTADQQEVIRHALRDAGVYAKEADLLSQQFNTAEIAEVLVKFRQNQQKIINPGGWIRRALENNAQRLLRYPNSDPTRVKRADQARRELQALTQLYSYRAERNGDPSLQPLRDLLRGAYEKRDMAAWVRLREIAKGNDQEWTKHSLAELKREHTCANYMSGLELHVA